ncbi:MAG: hypothetical protein ACYDG5_04365 [Dehalococcoidales bacterium]
MMPENMYTEKLTWFKQNEKPETVLLVADNPERIKLVIAWTNLSIGCADKLTELRSESENDIWEWLWENTDYSRAELKEKSGISYEIALENMMRPLIGNRVIYPDGTVNSYVQRYLREQVVKLFEAKPKRAVKKS